MNPAVDRPDRGPGLVLIGYRGTGKSTVGRIVAERTRSAFADADVEIEREMGQSIRSIFETEGEQRFRLREIAILHHLTGSTSLLGGVLATGGGAVLREVNRNAIRRFGLVVWLTADADTLARRLASSRHGLTDRPALTAAGTLHEVAAVLAIRTPIYQAVADLEVASAGRSVQNVADSVVDAWLQASVTRQVARSKGATR